MAKEIKKGDVVGGYTAIEVTPTHILWERIGPRKINYIVDAKDEKNKLTRVESTGDRTKAYSLVGLPAPMGPAPEAPKKENQEKSIDAKAAISQAEARDANRKASVK